MQDVSKGGHGKQGVLVSGHAEPVRRFLRDLVVDSPAGTNFAYVYEDPFRTQDEGFLRSGYYYPSWPRTK